MNRAPRCGACSSVEKGIRIEHCSIWRGRRGGRPRAYTAKTIKQCGKWHAVNDSRGRKCQHAPLWDDSCWELCWALFVCLILWYAWVSTMASDNGVVKEASDWYRIG